MLLEHLPEDHLDNTYERLSNLVDKFDASSKEPKPEKPRALGRRVDQDDSGYTTIGAHGVPEDDARGKGNGPGQ